MAGRDQTISKGSTGRGVSALRKMPASPSSIKSALESLKKQQKPSQDAVSEKPLTTPSQSQPATSQARPEPVKPKIAPAPPPIRPQGGRAPTPPSLPNQTQLAPSQAKPPTESNSAGAKPDSAQELKISEAIQKEKELKREEVKEKRPKKSLADILKRAHERLEGGEQPKPEDKKRSSASTSTSSYSSASRRTLAPTATCIARRKAPARGWSASG